MPRYTVAVAILVIVLVFTAAAAPMFVRTGLGQKTADDFIVVYSGAHAMLARTEIHAATRGMYIYSPLVAFVFRPFALLPQIVAAFTWLILIAIIILAATIVASRKIVEV